MICSQRTQVHTCELQLLTNVVRSRNKLLTVHFSFLTRLDFKNITIQTQDKGVFTVFYEADLNKYLNKKHYCCDRDLFTQEAVPTL